MRCFKYAIYAACALTVQGCAPDAPIKTASTPDAPVTCPVQTQGVVALAAAKALIGNDAAYPEEAPARIVSITAFDMDSHEVTNANFAKFVSQTGYVTTAEKKQPGFDVPGAAVFMTPAPLNPSWWRFIAGANWRAPTGPGSSLDGLENHPVVQVSHADATAYAQWAGRALPTEAQWEYAAKGGSDSVYVWGETRVPDGRYKANTWQGAFPLKNSRDDGFTRSAPVGCYDPNAYGLHDMIGNVWEWTNTEYQDSAGEKVYAIKGGSFLCAPSYCRRYRASARQPQEAGFSTDHIGFRTVSATAE